ncbi:hypothetical protein F5Y09DRAFT_17293 [Xylaria sp. FL1042]|nr:hypothetical protein F5Y09DRAFT_17293 [Xylaria sp. FL1042]
MLDPNIIISIVGSSVGLIVTLIGLGSRSVGVPRSRQHLLEVRRQKKILRQKLSKVEDEIDLLNGINAQGVRYLRRETRKLIEHSLFQIEKFERFYDKFIGSRTVRAWNYVAISAGSDQICKYAKRFEVYSDWITIAQLSISLTLISERASLGGTSVSSLYWRDINRLRDELDRVKRASEAHPGRLRKLRVNKGVNLGKLERYAEGLVLRFDASDTGTESSIVIVDDLPEVPVQYRSVSTTREWYHGHGRATQDDSPIARSTRAISMYNDQVDDIPRAPPKMHTSAPRYRPDTGRAQDGRRSRHSRTRNRTPIMHPEPSGSRRSLASTPDSGHDGDDEWNTVPISQGAPRPRERYHHSVSRDRTYTMTSGLGRSESVENSRQPRLRRRPSFHNNETRARPRSHQSYRSERGSDQEIRGRDMHRRSSRESQRNPTPLRSRPQSRASTSSRHTDARQEQQRYENVANIEIRPPTRDHRSRSSSANASSIPSRDSGYGSLGPERYSSSASVASTRRRSDSRSRRSEDSRFSGGVDRSRPPNTFDRTGKGVGRVEERIRRTSRGAR